MLNKYVWQSLTFYLILSIFGCTKSTQNLETALNSISKESLAKNTQILSSDKFEGRAPASKGEELTINFMKDEFLKLDAAISSGTATEKEKRRHKMLKSEDLLRQPFDDIFSTEKVDCVIPPYAPLARSKAGCSRAMVSAKLAATATSAASAPAV